MQYINEAGIALIKEFEGLRLEAYDDNGLLPGGTLTIGYGHTGPDVYRGQVITELDADQFLRHDVLEAEALVRRTIAAPITDNQFSALVSFAFNFGPGRATKPLKPGKDGFVTLADGRAPAIVRFVNSGRLKLAAMEFNRWVGGPAGTKKGLRRRRAAERALFEKV